MRTDPAREEIPDHQTLARRLHRFEDVLADRMATTVRQLPFGTARFSPALSHVWSLNDVQIHRPVAVSELLTALDRLYAEFTMGHRMVSTDRAEVAWSLMPALTDRGWSISRHEWMVHDGVTPAEVSPVGIGPVDVATWQRHADAFVADQEWGRSPEVQRDMAGRDRLLAERGDTTFVLSADGAAGCHVYRHGSMAQIENVHVLTHARGTGLGHGLLAAALAACGDASTVFLVADAEDWPRQWYARWGFVPVASGWEAVLSH